MGGGGGGGGGGATVQACSIFDNIQGPDQQRSASGILYDVKKPVVIQCDASTEGLGATLLYRKVDQWHQHPRLYILCGD